MKLNRPEEYFTEIFVRGVLYKIEFVKKLIVDRENILGFCEYGKDEKMISINSSQSLSEIRSTIVHEILHALDYEYKIGLKHEQVYALERAISDFLIENGGKL
jgi:Zn-dependent peptidase ImmA (M78 family)